MANLKQSTAYNRAFLIVQSSDHITGLTGAGSTPAVTISKNGAAFGAAAGAVTEIGNGWYYVAFTTADTGTPGDLAVHVTVASGDPSDFVDQVTANILGDTLPANVLQWNSTNVSSPATAGIPDVNVKNINNVSAASVTTVNANQGTTQPLNFTGTAGSALVKSDMQDIAGVAVSTTTAQIGVNVVNWNNTVVATPATAGIPDVNVKNINNVVAATPGAVGGILIAGTNAATTISGLTLNGAAASGATPANAGLAITGGAASITGGGVAAAAAILTGGAGAASTNGAAAGATITAGGTVTVSGNDGVKMVGTGNGNGLTLTHAGSGLDLNAVTSGPLQVNATQINGVSTSSVTTINANQGTTQPVNFTGTAGSALVKSDMIDIASAAVSTSSAQIGVNVVQYNAQTALTDANNLPKVDIEAINANTTAAVNLGKSAADMGRGTCTTGGTTTSIPTSAFSPGGASIVSGQFIGRTIIFDGNTATGALQGQASNITANTAGATPTFTVTALTTAPSSGDTFSVV